MLHLPYEKKQISQPKAILCGILCQWIRLSVKDWNVMPVWVLQGRKTIPLFQFLIAAIMNHHNQWPTTKLISYSLEDEKSNMDFTGLRSRCWQGAFLSGGSRQESVPLPFPLSRGCPHALAFSIFQVINVELSPSHTVIFLVLFSTAKDPINIGLIQKIRITSLS